MRGTCQRCGCTEELACEGGCGWVDEQKDFCSTCGRKLFIGAIEPTNLADAVLMIRVLRAAFFETGEQLLELRQLAVHVAANQGLIEAGAQPVHSEIWTPGDEL